MKLLQLTTKAYTAGIVIDASGVCKGAAPIVRWMIGKGEKWIRHHCNKHQIVIQDCGESNDHQPRSRHIEV